MEAIQFCNERIRALAAQPFIRPGGVDFDIQYALAVWDARDLVELERLANANPGQAVRFPERDAYMGFVPNP